MTRDEAVAGQHRRRRVVAAEEFDRHWRRWERLRAHAVVGCPVDVVTRDDAVPTLRALVRPYDEVAVAA